jgi:hypothetical protein
MGWSVGANLPRINIGGLKIGGQFGLDFTVEGFARIPTVGMFADEQNNAVWRQYTFGIRIATGYQWMQK